MDEKDNIYNYGKEGHSNKSNPYNNVNYPYLGVMGIRTGLVGVGTFDDG